MRLPSTAVRLGGILAAVAGSASVAVGAYSLYGLVSAHDTNRGAFTLLTSGCLLLGLGIPALAGAIILLARPPTLSTQRIIVPRLALLASGSLMLVAATLMVLAPVMGYTAQRPNAFGMAIFVALGFAFIRSWRKRVD